jgi:ABC-2 type transport system ATP-binding protein
MPVLELIDLARSFDGTIALDGVSFQVAPGTMVGFVGRNGAGKTTAMRIALGVLEADRGEVRWRGRPVDAAVRRRFGYLPEERGLYPKMRVHEQLVYFGRLHGLSKRRANERARETVETLGVADRANDRVEALSLGNQQRVQLAAALVHRPDLLVLDEPFSGLDPVGADALAEILRGETARGVPVLFSSHQLELVERLCDEVVLIHEGRIVANGPIAELRESRRRRLFRLEVSSPDAGWWEGLPGVELERILPDGGVILELAEGFDAQRLLDVARSMGDVTHFSDVQPTLAELFREVARA